ncbi:AHH domain-containing protein [Tenacibaculum maritimum]|uniref:AHH domain-containing protein n=1 Tax=Tenacibaculum maritimum TaxID=107401 RepID=UPI001330FCFA|nr:AHH domain-containing protein [Tenacibaculum maritimum]
MKNKITQKPADAGFHMNDAVNGIALKKFRKLTGNGLHGNHPAYDNFVQEKLDDFAQKFPNATPKQAKNYLENKLIPDLLKLIEDAKNSGLNLNEFFKTL